MPRVKFTHNSRSHHVVLAEKGAERLDHLRQVGVRAVDDLVVFALGLLVPVPGVLKGLDLRRAALPLGRFEEEIVVALGIERRVEVDEVNGFAREVVAEDMEVVAVVKLVHPARRLGKDWACVNSRKVREFEDNHRLQNSG